MSVWRQKKVGVCLKEKEFSIEELIRTLLESTYSEVRLRKVFSLSEEETVHLTQKGEWFGFWCFAVKKNQQYFVFGELSIQNATIAWSSKEQPFPYFAQIAYKKHWFERPDIRKRKVILKTV
jgi:hypothetical protein